MQAAFRQGGGGRSRVPLLFRPNEPSTPTEHGPLNLHRGVATPYAYVLKHNTVIGSTKRPGRPPRARKLAALEDAESTCDPREQAAAATAQLDERNRRTGVNSQDARIGVIESEQVAREGGIAPRIVITGIRRIHLSDNGILASDDRCRVFFCRNHGRG